MSSNVILLVLLAAILHAAWNAVIKVNADRLVVMAVTAALTMLITLPMILYLGLPPLRSLPYLLASMLLHTGYMLLLVSAYRHGDFGQVYPLARGSAPLIIAVIGVFFLNESLTTQQLVGVSLIATSIMALCIAKGEYQTLNLKAIAFALATGVFIAAYSVVDGLGARVTGNPHLYIVWGFFMDGFSVPIIARLRRKKLFWQTVRQTWKPGLAAAIMSLIAYWIVVWAFTQGPIAISAALRETSVIFAAIIAAVVLKENFGWRRLVLTGCIVVGIALSV